MTLDKIFRSSNNIKTVLAPMAGFTDAPFRRICAEFGCDMAVSEMVSAVAMVYKDKKTGSLAKITDGEAPTAIQIFGHDPVVMGEAAHMIAEQRFEGCDFAAAPVSIDINMGCPVKKIFTSGDGSALMKDPTLCAKIVTAVGKCKLPVTVKIRAGITADTKNAVEVALSTAEAGAAMICVHGRTREQMYAPGVDLDIIAEVRSTLPKSVIVVGNGDITDHLSAKKMVDYTGVDGVMIGRGALGRPWIFDEIKKGGVGCASPNEEEISELAIRLVREVCLDKGEYTGVRESRGRIAHFIRGRRGAAEKRAALNCAETLSEIEHILLSDVSI